MQLEIRTTARDMQGSRLADTLDVDQCRITASGLNPAQGVRISVALGRKVFSIDLTATARGEVNEVLRITPNVATFLPKLGAFSWTDDTGAFDAGRILSAALPAEDVRIEVQVWR